MLSRMWQPSRTKVLVGFAFGAVMLDMIADPPLFVTLPLLMASAFLIFWGLAPQQLLRGVQRMPRHEILIGWMSKFDDWFEGFAGGTAYDTNAASKLDSLHGRGREIRSVEDPAALRQAVADWTQEVTSCLDEYLPNETFMFQTIASDDAHPRSALENRLAKLRLIIGRYENLQWRPAALRYLRSTKADP
jgi:hypothetical protein